LLLVRTLIRTVGPDHGHLQVRSSSAEGGFHRRSAAGGGN
jgi:hypothetical protein